MIGSWWRRAVALRASRSRRRWVGTFGPFERPLHIDTADVGSPRSPIERVRDGPFDAVLLGATLDLLHPADVRDLLHRIRDHLDPGGLLILDSHRYGPHHLEEVLLRHGFHVECEARLGRRVVGYCCTVTRE